MTAVKAAHGAGEDGRTLCRSYAGAFAPDPAAPLAARLRARLEDGLHRGYTRLFFPPPSYRANGLPPAGVWVLAPLAAAPGNALAEVARRVSPVLDDALDRAARRRRQRWFERHMAGRTAEYRPAERFTR